MRVLLIEDDRATAQSIELMLKSEGFNVYTTDLGEEGVDLAAIYDYDLILLDIGLPDISGLSVLRQLRSAGVRTPVMMQTGQSEIATKVQAFSAGADDYITKPFHKDELIARCHAIVRRSKGHASASIKVGSAEINLDQKSLSVDGKQVHLTGKEYQVLELLALRKDTTITKEMVLNHLYGGMDEPELKIVDVFVCKLRKKLMQAGAGGHIHTIWGRGYVLRDEVGRLVLQKKGTPQSLVGRVLAQLAAAGTATRSRGELATAVGKDAASVGAALKQIQNSEWAVMFGRWREATWGITAAGLAEHKSRAALAATA